MPPPRDASSCQEPEDLPAARSLLAPARPAPGNAMERDHRLEHGVRGEREWDPPRAGGIPHRRKEACIGQAAGREGSSSAARSSRRGVTLPPTSRNALCEFGPEASFQLEPQPVSILLAFQTSLQSAPSSLPEPEEPWGSAAALWLVFGKPLPSNPPAACRAGSAAPAVPRRCGHFATTGKAFPKRTKTIYISLYICIHTYICLYIHTHTYIYMYICLPIYTHIGSKGKLPK